MSREDVKALFDRLPTVSQSSATIESAQSLRGDTKEIGKRIASSVNKVRSAGIVVNGQEDRVDACLAAAGDLLLVSSFASSSLPSQHLAVALTKEWMASFPSSESNFNEDNELLAQIRENRREALDDVNEAMKMLQTELALSGLSGDLE